MEISKRISFFYLSRTMADEGEFILRDTTGDPDVIEGQPTEAGDPAGVDEQPPSPNVPIGVERTSTRNEEDQTDVPTSPTVPPKTAEQLVKERAERQRVVMLRILIADYSRSESLEEAEEMAEEMVDYFVKKKPQHTEAMGHLCLRVQGANFRITRAQEVVGDLEGELMQLRKAKKDVNSLSRTRRYMEHARGLLRGWDEVESLLQESAERTAKTFYRPVLEEEPGARKVLNVKVAYEETMARLIAAEQEFDDLMAPPTPVPVQAAASTSAAPEEKKIFARDFVVKNYVRPLFSGDDETSAIRDFHLWRKQWAHAEQKIYETCKEADEGAMLHLLGTALEGSALQLISSALNHNAALATLEEKYHNIVALVESYDSHSSEAKGPEPQAAEILANIDRWPHLEELLNGVGIELRTYFLIHSQLAILDANAGNKNPSIRWTGHVKALMREKPDHSHLGEVYNLEIFKKWIHRVKDDAVTAAAQTGEEVSSARLFAVSAETRNSETVQGCLVCGPAASHKSASCDKVERLPDEEFFRLAKEKGWCAKCLRVQFSYQHAKACMQKCAKCQKAHLTSRHRAPLSPAKRNSDSQEPNRDRPIKKRKAEASREQRESAPSTSKDYSKDPGFQAALDKALDEREARKEKSAQTYARDNSRGRGKGREGKKKDGPKRDTSKNKNIKKEKK